MGMEFVAIQGWSPNDPWGSIGPNFTAIKSWGMNVIRIPLNETSWFNIACVKNGAVIDSDPGDNYRTRLKTAVDQATQQGLYVIIDLHLSAPRDMLNTVSGVNAQCPTAQNVMADSDFSIQFWSEVATAYKNYPNVMFELFNEPFLTQWTLSGTEAQLWTALRDGTMIDKYVPANIAGRLWQSAGLQQMLLAVRATGATNVVLASGMNYSTRLEQWYTYRPNDPLGQLAAVWHAYPTWGKAWGTPEYALPNYGETAYGWAQAILNNGIPVVVTEFGDLNAAGTSGSPFASALLPRLDTMGISYLGWTFSASGLTENQLIKDSSGTPTDGYGIYVKAHYLCRAAGTAVCL